MRVIAPEDLVVIKAVVHLERRAGTSSTRSRSSPIATSIGVRQAKHGARRVLSLIYAQSNDMLVPTGVIPRLFAEIYES